MIRLPIVLLATLACVQLQPAPTVRTVYAVPSDRQLQPRFETAISDAIHQVQIWYADQLDGYTFVIAEPSPRVCHLENSADTYETTGGWERVIEDLQHCAQVEHFSSTVWVIYIDADFDCGLTGELGRGAAGVAILHRGDLDGLTSSDNYSMCGYPPRGADGWVGGLAHEIGHAFELEHPVGCDQGRPECDTSALMWLGFYRDYPETHLTDVDKALLQDSPFFTTPRR